MDLFLDLESKAENGHPVQYVSYTTSDSEGFYIRKGWSYGFKDLDVYWKGLKEREPDAKTMVVHTVGKVSDGSLRVKFVGGFVANDTSTTIEI